MLSGCGITPLRTPYKAPNANSHAERFMKSVKRECLDHLMIIGMPLLQNILGDYKYFYNHHRPHQGIYNNVPTGNNQFKMNLLLRIEFKRINSSVGY